MSAPKDYTSLFETYFEYMKALVRTNAPHFGVRLDLADDIAAEILLRLYERDFLSFFDPTLTSEYNGEVKTARFKSFLSKLVLTYMRGICSKHRKLDERERLVLDQPVIVNGTDTATTWLEAFGYDRDKQVLEDDVISLVSCQQTVRLLRDYLKTVPRKSKTDLCDLPMLFELILQQYSRDGVLDVSALQSHFHISTTAIYNWLADLRTHAAAALGRPPYKRRERARRVPR